MRPLRVLVTRPQPTAAATAARLEALGHEAILLPLMQATHDPRAAMEALGSPHWAIAFTSAEALRALGGDCLAPHLQTPVFCVGAATAEAARQSGFQSAIAGPGTGAALARLIAQTHAPRKSGPRDLLYLAGQPRSPAFENALHEAGIPCTAAEVYRMSPIAHAPADIEILMRTRRPDAALFYSRETARHFLDLLGPDSAIRNTRLLCLSDHVASAVPQGFGVVAVAGEPTEDSLLNLL